MPGNINLVGKKLFVRVVQKMVRIRPGSAGFTNLHMSTLLRYVAISPLSRKAKVYLATVDISTGTFYTLPWHRFQT